MSLPYVSPTLMADYRQRIQLFARGSNSLTCIRSHFFPDAVGVCDLTSAKEQEEIFVLSNRSGATLKVSKAAMQIIANIVEIEGADAWYSHLKELKKLDREKKLAEEKQRDAQRNAPKAVVFKRRPSELLDKNKNT
jgi:hypothetical protein